MDVWDASETIHKAVSEPGLSSIPLRHNIELGCLFCTFRPKRAR